jgi:amino acid transporter
VASRGRPLAGSGGGGGPTASFFDYFFTTFLITALIMVAVVVWGLLAVRGSKGTPRGRNHLVSYLLSVAAGAGIALLLMHDAHFLQRFRQLDLNANRQHQTGSGARKFPPPSSSVRGAQIRWDEVAIVVALVAGATFFIVVGRSRKRMRPPSWRSTSRQAASVALDESLNDLRNEPNLRRAIIAAYARMEAALAGAGLARRPSEAPLEYLERALTSLDASSNGVRRLTVLFEWAKFSHHDPEPAMRDEAIDALVAVREELRPPVEAAVA